MSDIALILIAEDLEDDISIILRAFAKARLLNPVQIVRNGEEALAYLKGEGKFANRAEYPLPQLLLLDLKMPRIDGFEVLCWVRQQPGLSSLRVVVLTSSKDIRDVNLAYQLGANSFLVKPTEFERFVDLSHAINGHWIWCSRAPQTFRPKII